MKFLATLMAAILVMAGVSLVSARTLGQDRPATQHVVLRSVNAQQHLKSTLTAFLPALGRAFAQAHSHQATSTVTPVPTGTAVPTSTPTTNYPDPATLLDNRAQQYASIRRVHFDQSDVLEKPGVEKLTIEAIGDATCKGPAFKTRVSASDVKEGTGQSSKFAESYIVIKNKAWRKSSGTKHRWAKYAVKKVTSVVDNPLICPSASSSGGGSSSIQIKNVVNVGPDTFQGVAVWHLQATLVDTTTGTLATADYLVSQDHFLPYKSSVTATDAQRGVTETFALTLTKFGERLVVSAPRVGSTKP